MTGLRIQDPSESPRVNSFKTPTEYRGLIHTSGDDYITRLHHAIASHSSLSRQTARAHVSDVTPRATRFQSRTHTSRNQTSVTYAHLRPDAAGVYNQLPAPAVFRVKRATTELTSLHTDSHQHRHHRSSTRTPSWISSQHLDRTTLTLVLQHQPRSHSQHTRALHPFCPNSHLL